LVFQQLLTRTNGLASRSIPEGGSGSGGTDETLLIIAHLLAKRACFRAAEPLPALSLSKGPLEPVMACAHNWTMCSIHIKTFWVYSSRANKWQSRFLFIHELRGKLDH
jgi:hypothetical protein